VVIGSIAASVGVSSVLAAAAAELIVPEASTAATHAPPPATQPQPVTQQGTLVAVTADSLTTKGTGGSTQTFSVTPSTTAITESGQNASPAASIATAVAEKSAVGPQGRPMDFGL